MTGREHPTQQRHLDLTRRAIRLIRDRSPHASAGDLARLLGVSEAHLRRVFARSCGRRLGHHQMLIRLTRAATALRHTRRPILQIAFDAGYANPESFSRAYRTAFGESPRDYRQRSITPRSSPMESSPSPFNLNLVKIPVRDFAAARTFYRDALGLPEAFAVEAYGWAQYDLEPLPLCLYVAGMGGGDGDPGGDRNIHLAHPDLALVVRNVTDAGFPPEQDIVESDDGGRFVTLRDPDGNTFKVIEVAGQASAE